MAERYTSPGVFSNENLSSEFLGREVDAFKKIEIRNRLRQTLPVPILPNQNLDQGSTNLRLPPPPIEKESVILKKLVLNPRKQGPILQLPSEPPAKISPIRITPFSIFFHTSVAVVNLFDVFEHRSNIEVQSFGSFEHNSKISIRPFSVFEHTSNIKIESFSSFTHTSTVVISSFGIFVHTSRVVIAPFGIYTHISNVKPITFGVFEHDSYTITTPLEIEQHYSTTRSLIPYSLAFESKLAIPTYKPLYRTIISLVDRLKQSGLGTTKHLPQYFLSDFYANYIKVIQFGVFDHSSPLGDLSYIFTPFQGGLFPNPFDFDSQSAQGIFLGQGNQLLSSIVVDRPIEQILPYQGVLLQNDQYISLVEPDTPILDISLRQGVININNELFSFISLATPVTPEELPKGGVVPLLPPSPLINTQAQENAAQEPQSLRHSLDRLLATTLPRVKHGSATLQTTTFNDDFSPQQGSTEVDVNASFIGVNDREQQKIESSPDLTNIEYQADRAQAENEPVKKHGEAIVQPQKFEPGDVLTTKVNPLTGAPQIDQNGESSFLNLPEPTQGAPNSSQPDTLANSSTFAYAGLDLSRYKALSYGELQRKAASGERIEPSSPVAFASVDVGAEGDFVDLIINGIRFRSYITAFSETYSPSWNDVKYVGRQDILKQFTGVTRAASLAFKTAAFSRNDLNSLYLKLNRLAAETCIGAYSGNYLTSPITYITIGNWFRNVPCATNSLKFDVNPAEEPWDVGQPGVEGDDNPQMPMLVAVSIDFSILGTNSGASLNKGAGPYINYATTAVNSSL